ncbi:MAG: glutamate formimidoyltransferase [Armatimonadota bacterium]|nr:glutamate formimidoyltransferase [Armatimonadota bacterium]MDR5703921.1 glutamate formimidoyltransferase [Armatimonadota bacterium]MDR7434172.1 glutamate formimidoyltransferase [Armatimonadota bacterium]
MQRIVACVPNFSEGRRVEVIEALAGEVRRTQGVFLLDVSWDPSHHRCVLTFVGEPEAVKQAAFASAARAVELINMEEHRGVHPRIGAVDVIPFVPLANVTMAECVALAKDLGREIWEKLGVPVYLYAEAAQRPERRRLPEIRRGEYEGLKETISLPERHPDIGEPRLHPTAGATVVGARRPLIAFNVYLSTGDVVVAKNIARAVRESSGGLVNVQARGVRIEHRGIAQVTMNLLDPVRTPLPRVFELVLAEAARYGVEVVESEIVGLVPLDALVEIARHYLRIHRFSREKVLDARLLELLGVQLVRWE